MELKFYGLFPLLLLAMRRLSPFPVIGLLLGCTVAYRLIEWHYTGNVRVLSYWTLWGRADQFLLGSGAFFLEKYIKGRSAGRKWVFHLLGIAGLLGILGFWWEVNLKGGFPLAGGYASQSILWAFIPLAEAICFSLIIVSYLQLAIPKRLDTVLSWPGKWSYSIYLNHFHCMMLYKFLLNALGSPTGYYPRFLIAAFLAFPIMACMGGITYTCIEKPFLKMRQNYLRPLKTH